MKGAPRQRRASSISPAATRARIRVEETVSPSTSTSGTTRVSNSSRAASIFGSPLALAPKRKFSPTETCSAPSLLDQDLLDEFLGAALGELLVEGDHDQLLDAEPLDHVALDPEGHDQLRQRRRVQDLERVGVEGEHGVGVVDHRLVAEVDAVEGPDRDVARARLGVGQRGDLDAQPWALTQLLARPPGPARRPAPGRAPRPRPRLERADRRPAQLSQ